jgi:hypothetical protein
MKGSDGDGVLGQLAAASQHRLRRQFPELRQRRCEAMGTGQDGKRLPAEFRERGVAIILATMTVAYAASRSSSGSIGCR